MRSRILLLILAVGSPRVLPAHEGHDHKAMGTVASVSEASLELETTGDGKLSLVLAAETTYRRGEAPASRADVKPGLRAAVTYFEKDGKKTAREVRLPAASTPPVKAKP